MRFKPIRFDDLPATIKRAVVYEGFLHRENRIRGWVWAQLEDGHTYAANRDDQWFFT